MSSYPLIKRCGLSVEVAMGHLTFGEDNRTISPRFDVVKAEDLEMMLSKATKVYQGKGQAFATDWCPTMPESNRCVSALLVGAQDVKPKEVTVTRHQLSEIFLNNTQPSFNEMCAGLGL